MTIDLEEFRAWVAGQSGEYDYNNIHWCPLAQFLYAQTGKNVTVGGHTWSFEDEGEYFDIPPRLDDILTSHPRTFPALLERLT